MAKDTKTSDRRIDKHAGGRPSKYKPEYCQMIIDFFNREPYETILIDSENGGKTVALDKFGNPILKPCALPTKERFAFSIGVISETLTNWCLKYPEFFDAFKKAEALQKDILIQNGLVGAYDKTFAIFTARNVTNMSNMPEQERVDSEGGEVKEIVIKVHGADVNNQSNK